MFERKKKEDIIIKIVLIIDHGSNREDVVFERFFFV